MSSHRRYKSDISRMKLPEHNFDKVKTTKKSGFKYDEDLFENKERMEPIFNNFVLVGNSCDEKLREESQESIIGLTIQQNTSRNLLNNSRRTGRLDLFVELSKVIEKENLIRETPNELKFIDKIKETEIAIENEISTADLYLKIKIDEIICALFTFIGIISGIYYKINNLTYNEVSDLSNNMYYILGIVSISVFLFIVCTILKYLNYLRLYRSATYCCKADGLIETKLYKGLLIETILALIHPNIYFHSI